MILLTLCPTVMKELVRHKVRSHMVLAQKDERNLVICHDVFFGKLVIHFLGMCNSGAASFTSRAGYEMREANTFPNRAAASPLESIPVYLVDRGKPKYYDEPPAMQNDPTLGNPLS